MQKPRPVRLDTPFVVQKVETEMLAPNAVVYRITLRPTPQEGRQETRFSDVQIQTTDDGLAHELGLEQTFHLDLTPADD